MDAFPALHQAGGYEVLRTADGRSKDLAFHYSWSGQWFGMTPTERSFAQGGVAEGCCMPKGLQIIESLKILNNK